MARLDAPGRAWLGLALGLAAGSIVVWWLPPWPLDWQPAQAIGQPGRAWTAAFVHWNGSHLALNLSGCLLIGLLGWRAALPTRAALAWLLAWPLTQLGLAWLPAGAHYGGLSGVLHAGLAVLAGMLASVGGRSRRLGLLLLAGLAFKLAWEALAAPRGVAVNAGLLQLPVVAWAHTSGVAAGLLAVGLLRLVPRAAPPSATLTHPVA